MEAGASAGSGADPATATAPTKPRRRRPDGILRVDLEALLRGGVVAGEVCEIHGTGPITIDAAFALLTGADLYLVVHDGALVRHVTHIGRRRPPGTRIAGHPPASRQAGLRVTAILRLHLDHLRRDLPGPWADLAGVGIVDRTQLARHLGDSLVPLVEARGVAVQTAVFACRSFPPEIRIAAFEQQPRCADCGSPNLIEGDHEIPSALDGPTSLANYTPRCRRHHRVKSKREAQRTIRAGKARAAARRRQDDTSVRASPD